MKLSFIHTPQTAPFPPSCQAGDALPLPTLQGINLPNLSTLLCKYQLPFLSGGLTYTSFGLEHLPSTSAKLWGLLLRLTWRRPHVLKSLLYSASKPELTSVCQWLHQHHLCPRSLTSYTMHQHGIIQNTTNQRASFTAAIWQWYEQFGH